MAKYRVKETAFFKGSRVRPGEVVEGPDGLTFGWLERIEAPAAKGKPKPEGSKEQS